MNDTPATVLRGGTAPSAALRFALVDSRQRWRDLVTMSADLAFETDASGRLVFVVPDPVLGWSATNLIGQPAAQLLAGGVDTNRFSPFCVTSPVRRRRAWLRRADGSVAALVFAAAPLLDAEGRVVGARGLGIDWTKDEAWRDVVAESLRRGEVLDHILRRMGQEVLAPRMMSAALVALMSALGAEGAAVIELRANDGAAVLVHQAGTGAALILASAAALLTNEAEPASIADTDGRTILVAACHTRFGAHAGLALWRAPGARGWDPEEHLLISAAASLIRMVLEHEAIQQEMARQARTDPLTGLLNRRAFLEEMERRIERLDREIEPGTLMFVDLDNFKPINDQLGHDVGDRVLTQTAELLRNAVRPMDLVARLGGDEFALWLDGADSLTAAERADWLCQQVPDCLRALAGDGPATPTVSIGIAMRAAGSNEPISNLLRRADRAMYAVKRGGRGHWRVANSEDT
jgi:diguanylate cyclase (GGDEF)-like protein